MKRPMHQTVFSTFSPAGLYASTALLVSLLAGGHAGAQIGGSGSIQGTVSDPTGAAVPGARVTATNTATNNVTRQQTGSSGFYSLAALTPGTYTVDVTAPGFSHLSQQQVVVDALSVATINLTLTVGAAADVVTVTDEPPQLDTSDATLGLVVRNEEYAALPLAMNAGPRDPTAFVALVPGVQAFSAQAAGTSFATFNGGQPYLNEVYIEGIPATNAAAQGETRNLAYGISVEAVDQFQVETNNSPAMYQGQGIENYTIKSGANKWHGSAYEYFRNTVLDARGFFPTVRPVEKQNQFGGDVSGYIKKDKLFFFGNFDGFYYRSTSVPTLQSVPTTAMLAGDFSAVPQPIYDPLSTTCTAAGVCSRTQFSYQGRLNVIDPARISPASASLASYLPQVSPAAGIQNNYLSVVPIGLHVFSTTDRIDYNINSKNRMYGIFSKGQYKTDGVAAISANTSALPLPYTASRFVTEKPLTIQVHEVYSITPNLLNQIGYSYARLQVPITSATSAGQYPMKAGLAGLPPGQASTAFPTINFTGVNSPQSWAGTNSQAFDEAANTYVVQDNVQIVTGKHSITAGAQYSWLQDNYTSPDNESDATFNFVNSETAAYTANGTVNNNTGNAFASYLLGSLDTASLQDNAVITTGARYKDLALYVEDNYKLRPNLTLNLGLRYDIFGVYNEAENRASFLNPTLPNPAIGGYPGALQFTGKGADSCNCSTPVATHHLDFGPRIGGAWAPNPRTSVRAGFAIMYAHGNGVGGRAGGRTGTGILGFDALPSFVGAGNGAPAFFWTAQPALPAAYANVPSGGIPAYQKAPFFNPSLNSGFYVGAPSAGTITFGDPVIGGKPPVFNNYTFSVQQALTQTFNVTLVYTGSQGHDINNGVARSAYADQINPAYLALGADLNLPATPANLVKANADAAAAGLSATIQLPFSNFDTSKGQIGRTLLAFPQYSAITDIWNATGNTNYNALEVIANQRARGGLTFQAAYTLSKEIDDITSSSRTAYNIRAERSLGAIDRKHVITSSGNWVLPFGKGKRFATNGVASALAGGFELSSIFTLSSGAPLTITSTACNAPYTGSECLPNYTPGFTGSAAINGGLSSGLGNTVAGHSMSYINKAAFSPVAPYTFGNLPRTAPYGLRSPYVWDQDLTVRRTFSLFESVKLNTAVSAFNIYNAVNFGGVTTNYDSTSFGRVTSQANAPRKLQAEARITF